jgi:putative membrane protein
VTGLVVFLGLNIVRGIRAFVPIFIALAISEKFKFPMLAGSIALGAILVGWTVLEFMRFTYHVEKGNTFVVERGVLRRERLEIPFSRIQAVHLTRGVLQRVLGLTGLAIDTAGSDENELQLRALKFEEAQRLRRLLSPDQGVQEAEEGEGPVLVLKPRDLIRIGLTMNHFRNGMIAFGGVVGFGGQITDLIVGRIEALPAWQMMLFSLLSALFWVFGVFIFASLGVVISMVMAVVRFYGLRLELAGDRLELASGLFRRNEFSILLRKVQILKFRSSWLQRAFGLEGLTLHQARSSSDASEKAVKLAIPGLTDSHSARLLAIFCPHWNPGAAHVRTLRPIAFHRWLAICGYALMIPGPVVLLGFFAGMPILATLVALAGLRYAFFAGSALHAALETRTDGEIIEAREGWFVKRRTILRAHQLQRVTLSRNIFQIRRGSASLHLHSAAGTVILRHIPHKAAASFADELLARIEQHDGPWM